MRMRMIAVVAILMASFPLGGCFHHHQATDARASATEIAEGRWLAHSVL